MRRYETILIFRPDLGESAQKEAIHRYEGIIASSGGDMAETEEWGYRELAYRIKGERRGFYVRLDYGGNGATMNEVERNLKNLGRCVALHVGAGRYQRRYGKGPRRD